MLTLVHTYSVQMKLSIVINTYQAKYLSKCEMGLRNLPTELQAGEDFSGPQFSRIHSFWEGSWLGRLMGGLIARLGMWAYVLRSSLRIIFGLLLSIPLSHESGADPTSMLFGERCLGRFKQAYPTTESCFDHSNSSTHLQLAFCSPLQNQSFQCISEVHWPGCLSQLWLLQAQRSKSELQQLRAFRAMKLFTWAKEKRHTTWPILVPRIWKRATRGHISIRRNW